MSQFRSCVAFLVVVSQIFVSTVVSQDGDPFMGYYIEGNTAIKCSCPSNVRFYSSTTFDDDRDRTYAFCDKGGDPGQEVGTSCDRDNVAVTGVGSNTARCPENEGCITVMLYKSYPAGPGDDSRYLISCANSIGIPTSIGRMFFESPKNYQTSSTDETTTTAGTLTTTKPTLTSNPTPTSTNTSTEKDGENKADGGPNAGTIAGAVVGSVAAVALIIGALFLGFRMGRRHQAQDDNETQPRGFGRSLRDTVESIPRPVLTWHRPKPKHRPEEPPVAFLQMNVPEDGGGSDTKAESEAVPSPGSRGQVMTPTQGSPQPIDGQIQHGESLGAELPTGLDSQGWVRSESHPLPYEADSTTVYRPPPA